MGSSDGEIMEEFPSEQYLENQSLTPEQNLENQFLIIDENSTHHQHPIDQYYVDYYHNYLTYQPLTVEIKVRKNPSDPWQDAVDAEVGDDIECKVEVENDGVLPRWPAITVKMPFNLDYINGSASTYAMWQNKVSKCVGSLRLHEIYVVLKCLAFGK